MRKLIQSEKFFLLLLFILIGPTLWALFVPGYFGASDDLHIAWLYEMYKTIGLGQLPPRFVPDLSFGFGYPLFNFVFPLPFYIGSLFHFLGFSLVDSIKAVFGLSIILSTYFMYLLIKELSDRYLALTGALIYAYTPYRAVDLYVRGAIGEVVAFIFLPLITLSIIKICRGVDQKRDYFWVGIGGLSLGGLVLTHNITSYMLVPFLLLLIILSLYKRKDYWLFLRKQALLFTLGGLVSIYFWLPAFLDSVLMKYDTVFNFADHYPTLTQLFTPYWGYGGSNPGPNDGISFFIGIPNIILILFTTAVFILLFRKFNAFQKVFFYWSVSAILIAVFMMNYRSVFVWTHLPFLKYFQFPWRFLIITTFFTPLLIIFLNNLKFKKFLCLGLIFMTLFVSHSYFKPQDFLGRQDDYYLNKYIPIPKASLKYLQTQEEYLRLPIKTTTRPSQNFPRFSSDKNSLIDIKRMDDLNANFKINTLSPVKIDYYKYNFPGWFVKVNGIKTKIESGVPYGQISFLVPSGNHDVEIGFSETYFKLILDLVSLLALVLCGFLILIGKIKKLL